MPSDTGHARDSVQTTEQMLTLLRSSGPCGWDWLSGDREPHWRFCGVEAGSADSLVWILVANRGDLRRLSVTELAVSGDGEIEVFDRPPGSCRPRLR